MTEAQSSEIEKVLLFVSDAKARAHRAANQLRSDGAEDHLVQALEETERRLGDAHRQLSQGTYYAIPDDTLDLAV